MNNAKQDEMRNLIITTEAGSSIEETFKSKSIEGWSFEKLGISMGHEYCFNDGSTKVAVRFSTENIAVTSNVLPHDNNHDQDKAKDALLRLKNALLDADIESYITASDKELGIKS